MVLEGHHAVRAHAVRGRQIWLGCSELLERPTVAADYLDLTARFDSWVLSAVPPLSRMIRKTRQRFMLLIDVLSDQDIALTVLAEVPRAALNDVPDYFRAESRLALLQEG